MPLPFFGGDMKLLTAAGAWLAGHTAAAVLLAALNLASFALYGADKRRSVRGGRRIPERTLLLSAALFGGAGALAGMYVFRHKTKHVKFTVLVPAAAAAQLALLLAAVGTYLAGS